MPKIRKEDAFRPYKHLTTTFNIPKFCQYKTLGEFVGDFQGALHPSVDLKELYEILLEESYKRGLKDRPKKKLSKKDEEGSSSTEETSES